MSTYLEIPVFESELLYRSFLNDGMGIVYPHWHKEIEIIYSIVGSVRIGVGDTIIQVDEGEIYFFSSGEPHYFLASPESERYVYQFDLNMFDEKTLRVGEQSLLSLFETRERHSRNWSKEAESKVREILLNLYRYNNESADGTNYLLLSELYHLIGTFYQALPQTHQEYRLAHRSTIRYKETLERLNKVFDYVEEHFLEPITLEEVAHFVGFSPYYFTRFFKTNTGKTFMGFLNEYRITQAKFILANEKIPMAEVAEKSGFTSVKTFHHVFKESVGVAPLQYQKQLNETL
ncbi:AraC family transcriptional regulator [Enterococcus sp. JM4C]|uniref:AraC family transcriptional regulator n=1 Tax=Candidatus Enterococcus huntleyi TaxID=1857217 RepID=UPI00137A7D2B|nr:AraC family transcriptional regulator [Enterococcus sp. JM4C]KAF1299493.1 AraC family transcriptional regulator [Enterococcus sp. JM4C]